MEVEVAAARRSPRRRTASARVGRGYNRRPMSEPDAPERRRPHRSASGIEIEPVYGPADSRTSIRPPRWVSPARSRTPAASIPTAIAAGRGRCASTPASARPRRRTAASATSSSSGQTGPVVAFDLPTQMGYDSDDPMAVGEVGRDRRADRLDRRHGAAPRRDRPRRGLDLDDDQRHRRDPAGAVRDGGATARRRPASAARDDPERHPQGVHRARDLHLPARAVDAPGDRYVRLLPHRAAGVEHDQHQRLPHARGRGDGDPGGRLHGRQRDRLCRCGAGRRDGLRRLRAAPVLLLRRPRRPARGGREVPRRPPDVGDRRARTVRRDGPEEPGDALPRPDRRLDAHRPAAGRQRRAHDGPGAGRRPRRDAVAAHERARRGARPADAGDRAAGASDTASAVSRGLAWRRPSTRWRARTTSRR